MMFERSSLQEADLSSFSSDFEECRISTFHDEGKHGTSNEKSDNKTENSSDLKKLFSTHLQFLNLASLMNNIPQNQEINTIFLNSIIKLVKKYYIFFLINQRPWRKKQNCLQKKMRIFHIKMKRIIQNHSTENSQKKKMYFCKILLKHLAQKIGD